ncbi:zinc finger matrin-type protein 4-like isoform X2 [Xenopus laevis]|uniref:Zinc finger matrin-type protein 4-like isoform X2 n=1 Tax=Xenopus laevis TaxID=8355 RepID=A0A8J1L513_XENLA|nr:zinc finger matrin-type protein 4-like isoform X2 [Xenopus laevis]
MYSACAGKQIAGQGQMWLEAAASELMKMNSAEVEDRVLFTDTYCKICNAQLISESQRVAHYESKKHANKVRLYYMLHPEDGGPPSKKLRPDDPESDETEVDKNKCCTLCNMFFTSAIVAESHYQGKTHAKRVKLVLGESPNTPAPAEPIQETPEHTEIPPPEEDTLWNLNIGNESRKFCDLCRAWFNNPLMAQQHYEGKKHKKNAARAKLLQRLGETLDSEALEALRSSYTCNVCNMVLNSVEQYHAHLKGARHQNNANNISDGTKPLGNGTPQNPAELQRQQRGNSYTKINMQKRCGKEGKDNDSGRSSLSPPQISEVTGDCSPENTFFSAMVEEESHILC